MAFTVFYLSDRWKKEFFLKWSTLKEKDQENFNKSIEVPFNFFVDRWLLCSRWAGIWSSSSAQSFNDFAELIAVAWMEMKTYSTSTDFIARFEKLCNDLLDRVTSKAIDTVNSLVAERNTVSQYRTMLWLWHRLNKERFVCSLIQMRMKKSGKGRAGSLKMEVDHTVSYATWCEMVEKEVEDKKKNKVTPPEGELDPAPNGYATKGEAINWINRIGNCSLLQTNFNRSKNKGTLWSFMKGVNEFETNKVKREYWEEQLGLFPVLTDLENPKTNLAATIIDIKEAIDIRTITIRSEIVDFIKDRKKDRFGVEECIGELTAEFEKKDEDTI